VCKVNVADATYISSDLAISRQQTRTMTTTAIVVDVIPWDLGSTRRVLGPGAQEGKSLGKVIKSAGQERPSLGRRAIEAHWLGGLF
jgi:hypothetical protein